VLREELPARATSYEHRGSAPRAFGVSSVYAPVPGEVEHVHRDVFAAADPVHVRDPVLLVLDEPFSGLDPIATETMADILREETARGKAVVFSSHQLDLVEDICEDVAIINAGNIVVEGNVRRLKDAAPIRHLELELDGDTGDLLDGLDGVRQVQSNGDGQTAIVDASTDIRGLLVRAQEAGRVRHFAYTTPSLTDLFREAVR